MEVLPAIIPKNLDDLRNKLSIVRGMAPAVQIDVVDGIFASPASWPYQDGQEEKFKKICNEEGGIPFGEDFYFEADLMIEKPEKRIEDFICAGFGRIIVHIESTKQMQEIITKAREFDTEIGIAINIDTPNDVLEDFIDEIDVVQCMGIAEIGSQGQPFDRRVLQKISALRGMYPELIISIDGGVSEETASLLVLAGVDRLVSGSAIFESLDPQKIISQFSSLGN